jgi:tetratricopeptide (TPR) repeat protein
MISHKITKTMLLITFIGLMMVACGGPKPTEEPQATATLAPPTDTPTSEPTDTPTPEPTDIPTPASTDTPTPIPAPNYLEAGDSAYEAEDYERAIAAYEQAIDVDPELAAAYNSRGRAYAELDEYKKAIADYDKAIELDPQDAQTYFQRATLLYDTGHPDEALDDLDQAIEIDPKFAMAYAMRSMLYMEMGEPEKALADMERAVELEPELAEAIQSIYEEIQAQGQDSEEGEGSALILQPYEHPDGVFTLDYPVEWEAIEEGEGIVMFAGAESLATGQMMMVMFGSTEQLFEGMDSPSLAEAAKQITASSWAGAEVDYEIIAEEQVSENRVYLSTTTEAAPGDQSFVLDLYVDQAEETAFVLLMMSMRDSDFHQAWDAIVESYTIYPEAVP